MCHSTIIQAECSRSHYHQLRNPDLMGGRDRGENMARREVKLAGLMLCRIFVCRTGIQRDTSLRIHSENVRGGKINKPLNSVKEGICRNLSSYFRYYTRMEFLNPLGVSGGHSKVILSVWTSSKEAQRTKISMSHPQLWAGRDKKENVRMLSSIMNPHRPPNPPIFNP